MKDFKWKDVTMDLEVFWTQIPAPDEVSSQILFKATAFYWRSGVFSWLRFGGTFSEQRSVRIFAFGWQPIEPGFLPRKKMKLCFLPSPGAPHASRHKRKHQTNKKHNNYFLPFSGSKQSLPGAFCYQNLCWKTKLNTEFKLKVQNPDLRTDPLIWVWNSLFFSEENLFSVQEKTPEVHEVSQRQRTRTTLEIKFLRRWKKSWTLEGKQHKTLPGFVKEKEAKEYSCSCRSGKKKLYFYIYL